MPGFAVLHIIGLSEVTELLSLFFTDALIAHMRYTKVH